jgi:uncharacterized protein YegP (UPF0339 family)
MITAEIWKTRRGWTWRLRARNGKIVCWAGEDFYGKSAWNARRAIKSLLRKLDASSDRVRFKEIDANERVSVEH